MKRIRIGNDVVVRTSLDEFETNDKLKIKTLQCLFIKQKHNDKSDNDMCYEPSQYVYGCCGCCNYNAAVFNNGYNMPCTLRDPHWFPGYNGFGVNSNKFNCPKEYQSDVRVFDNYVESYFPAKDQKLGIFKVVFVAQVYTTGWGMNDLKTITIDKGELFALVDSSEESTTDGLIDLTGGQGGDQEGDKLIVDKLIFEHQQSIDMIDINPGDTLELLDYDNSSNRYAIIYSKGDYCDYITKETAKHFDFSITQYGKPALSTIDEFGTITCKKEEDLGSSDSDICVNVKSKYNLDITSYVKMSAYQWNSIGTKYTVSSSCNFTCQSINPSDPYSVNPLVIPIKIKPNRLNAVGFKHVVQYVIQAGEYSIVDKYYMNRYLSITSSNPDVAIIDEYGDIIINKKGSTRITINDKVGNYIYSSMLNIK